MPWWVVEDLKAAALERCQHGPGAYWGCAWCWMKGVYAKNLKRMMYGNFRAYLPPDHPMRDDVAKFGSVERGTAPSSKTDKQILAFGTNVQKAGYKPGSQNDPAKCHGITGISALWTLKETAMWKGFQLLHTIEGMHLIHVASDRFVKLIGGKRSIKPKTRKKVEIQARVLTNNHDLTHFVSLCRKHRFRGRRPRHRIRAMMKRTWKR